MKLFRKKAKPSNDQGIPQSSNTPSVGGVGQTSPTVPKNAQSGKSPAQGVSTTKKKFPKVLIVVIGLVWLTLLYIGGSFVLTKVKGFKSTELTNNPTTQNPQNPNKPNPADKEKSETPDIQNPSKGTPLNPIEESKTPPPKTDSEFGNYENTLLGIKLQYPGKWFHTEQSDKILNVVKASSVNDTFDITKNPLKSVLSFVTFKANDTMNTLTMLTFSPQQLLLGANFTSTTVDAAFIQKVDEITKSGYGSAVAEYTPTYIKEIGTTKCAITEFTYNPSDKISVIQATIPYGGNTLTIVSASKSGPNSIDKMVVTENIIKSLTVGTPLQPEQTTPSKSTNPPETN